MGPRLGAEFIAATGGEMDAFGTADRLASFAGLAPDPVTPAASAAICTGLGATTEGYCEPCTCRPWSA